ncbi:MFS general substrate transporter [Trametes coccinea BRFM310]|uniref:MFS general substrate transporter n=1 Tax=Trametes coccinea (strain BRFM310) TaxID=1353009 RepID=A0A1Y2IWX8_TRAC3|nr:MFS general substrate transporter [Trametes coccinea BRFM310]
MSSESATTLHPSNPSTPLPFEEKRGSFLDVEKAPASPPVDEGDSECPDGGLKAWLCIFGIACGLCATFGFVNSWGVFQAYYEELTLRNRSPSDIAWIGSIQYACVFMPGLAFGRLFDMGYLRLPVGAASALLVACTMLIPECKEFWHFLLCQGFGIGLASGVIFTAAAGTAPHWFSKKLGLALACVAGGSSIGGTIFPIILRNLIERQSFGWTLRITGFILAGFLLMLNLTISRRLPPKKDLGPFLNLSMFKSPAYTVYTLSLFVGFLGIYSALTYISLSGITEGVDPNLSFYLTSIANGCSLIGRLGGGLLADRFGPVNILIPGTLIAAVTTYAWPFATTKGSLVAIAVIYGASSGVYVSINPLPITRMSKVQEVGTNVGMAFSVMSCGALAGPPIAGAILDHTGSFKNVGYYAGTCLVASVALFFVARQLILGGFKGHA